MGYFYNQPVAYQQVPHYAVSAARAHAHAHAQAQAPANPAANSDVPPSPTAFTMPEYKRKSSGLNSATPSKSSKFKLASSRSSSISSSSLELQLHYSDETTLNNTDFFSNTPGPVSSSNSSYYNLQQQSTQQVQISKTPTRSIILFNISSDLSLTDFLNQITVGPIENIRLLENYPDDDVNSIQLSFLKSETCLNFYNNVLTFLSTFKKLIKSPNLTMNFIHSRKILPFVLNAINNDGATRNVFIGDLNLIKEQYDKNDKLIEINENWLRNELTKFGLIEKIELIVKEHEKSAFVHFTNIPSAIKAVEQLTLNENWSRCKIFYGTDRCCIDSTNNQVRSITDEDTEIINEFEHLNMNASNINNLNEDVHTDITDEDKINNNNGSTNNNNFITATPIHQINNHQPISYDEFSPSIHSQQLMFPNNLQTPNGPIQYLYQTTPTILHHPQSMNEFNDYNNEYNDFKEFSNNDYSNELNEINESNSAIEVARVCGGEQNIGNRTVYLGNLEPKTKVEDICNAVRGGILENIRYFPNKNICFLTFIDPTAAARFYANGVVNSIRINGKKLRIGWGKQSGPLQTSVQLAVTVGASRNIYIGVKDEDLGEDDIPLVNLPTEEVIRKDFSKYGEIEQINYFKNNRCVFVNFTNILNAIKVNEDANGVNSKVFHKSFDGKYENFKISFGKDRCGNPPKSKKKKKKKKNNTTSKNVQLEHGDDEHGEDENEEHEGQDHYQDDDEDDTVILVDDKDKPEDEVPAELFAQMGITTKSEDPKDEPSQSKSKSKAKAPSKPNTRKGNNAGRNQQKNLGNVVTTSGSEVMAQFLAQTQKSMFYDYHTLYDQQLHQEHYGHSPHHLPQTTGFTKHRFRSKN